MFQRTPLVAPRYGSDTALLIRRVVEVKNGCDHTVVLMREERIILMHGKWRSLLRWLDKHFIVVKLHVWTPNDLCRNPGNALIREQPTESSRVKLDIMAMQDLRLFDRPGNHLRTSPSGVHILVGGQSRRQCMAFCPVCSRLFFVELPLHEKVAISL